MQKARSQPCTSEDAHRSPTACKYTVSGTISLTSSVCFSTFIHITYSLSVVSLYLALASGLASFLRGSTCPVVLGNLIYPAHLDFIYRTFTFFGWHSHAIQLSKQLCIKASSSYATAIKPHNLLMETGTTYHAIKI